MKVIHKIIIVVICVAVGYCIWRYYRNNVLKFQQITEPYSNLLQKNKTIKDICDILDFDSQTNNNQKNKNNQSDVLAILDENTDITKYLKQK